MNAQMQRKIWIIHPVDCISSSLYNFTNSNRIIVESTEQSRSINRWHVRQKRLCSQDSQMRNVRKEEKSLQVRRWEESKKPEDWICGVGDNSPVRAEGDSHNYKFLPLQFFIMLWQDQPLKGKLGENFLSAQSFYPTLTKRSFKRQF